MHSSSRSQTHVVNLRIRAPDAASGNRDLEFTRKIVELIISRQHLRCFESKRRGIADFVSIHPGNWATGHVSCDVSARTHSVETGLRQRIEHVGESLDRHPMQLDILADGDVTYSVSITTGEIGNCA